MMQTNACAHTRFDATTRRNLDMTIHRRYLHAFAPLLFVVAVAMSQSLAFAAEFPIGSYTAHRSITLTFEHDGQFRVLDGKDTVVSGGYRIQGDRLELTDQGGPWACTKDGEQTGTYSWKYDHAVLTLTKVADHCDARAGTLTPASWHPKSS
jgi:hypothetical protein